MLGTPWVSRVPDHLCLLGPMVSHVWWAEVIFGRAAGPSSERLQAVRKRPQDGPRGRRGRWGGRYPSRQHRHDVGVDHVRGWVGPRSDRRHQVVHPGKRRTATATSSWRRRVRAPARASVVGVIVVDQSEGRAVWGTPGAPGPCHTGYVHARPTTRTLQKIVLPKRGPDVAGDGGG